MATKPTDTFTYATNANHATGPAAGQPTKVSPPGAPTIATGRTPGDPYVAEYDNWLWNVSGQWINGWLLAGSSAGAANAHIVETDAAGSTALVSLAASGSIRAAGRITSHWSNFRDDFMGLGTTASTFGADYWTAGGTGGTTARSTTSTGGVVTMTSGATSGNEASLRGPANQHKLGTAFVIECVARITSAITTVRVEIGVWDSPSTQAFVDLGVIVRFDTSLGDTAWTLAGDDGVSLTTDASSIAPVQNTWYRFRIEAAADGSANLYIGGVLEASIAPGTLVSSRCDSAAWVETLTAANRVLEIDSFEVWAAPNA